MSGSLARDPRRTPLTGSSFVRTVAALDAAPAPAAPDAFAQRLAHWFDWTQAFSLSAALGDAADRSEVPGFGGRGALAADERELARVRAALQRTIADAPAGGPEPRRIGRPLVRTPAGTAAPADTAVDFAAYRQRYAQCQLAMETQVVPLRRRLRSSLADRSPVLAKLAELDTVMEQVVGAQERTLLATLGARLEPRFDALRGVAADAPLGTPSPPGPWLDTFHQEMRQLLLAELDLRLQPVEGLLEACRQSPTNRS